MKNTIISIDLTKSVFQICGLDENQHVMFNKKVKREQLLHELCQQEPTTVVMEACYSSNPWGREIEKLGHQVKLVPAFRVKPFVVGNKNDNNDALAIAEAALRPNMRFVKVKTISQQDIQTIFRVRERLIRNRTGLANQLRDLLSEYGVVAAKTLSKLRKVVPDALEDASNQLSYVARRMIDRLYQQWRLLDQDILEVE